MTKGVRKRYSNGYKLKVAIAAIKGDKTVAQLSSEFGVMSSQIYTWKQQLLEDGAKIFADKRRAENQQKSVDKHHQVVGELAAKCDFLSRVFDRSK